MNRQTKTILIKIDDELKNSFSKKASEMQMKISTRIKYLMKMDVENKILIKNG